MWAWVQTSGHGFRPVGMGTDQWAWVQTSGHGYRPEGMGTDQCNSVHTITSNDYPVFWSHTCICALSFY